MRATLAAHPESEDHSRKLPAEPAARTLLNGSHLSLKARPLEKTGTRAGKWLRISALCFDTTTVVTQDAWPALDVHNSDFTLSVAGRDPREGAVLHINR